MPEIIIKITISEKEYKDWSDFEGGDVAKVKKTLIKDFREICENLGIDDCKIEVISQ